MSTNRGVGVSGWTGWVIFAGLVLMFIGCINAIEGLAALLKRTVYTTPSQDLIVTTNYPAWGWTLLIWGIVMFLAGLGLFAAKGWARWVAIIVVFLNLIGQFAWFPSFPLWGIVVISLNIVVLFALTIHWQDVRADLDA